MKLQVILYKQLKDDDMNDKESRKPYIKPEITHEMELETRAGSVIDINELNDPFEMDP